MTSWKRRPIRAAFASLGYSTLQGRAEERRGHCSYRPSGQRVALGRCERLQLGTSLCSSTCGRRVPMRPPAWQRYRLISAVTAVFATRLSKEISIFSTAPSPWKDGDLERASRRQNRPLLDLTPDLFAFLKTASGSMAAPNRVKRGGPVPLRNMSPYEDKPARASTNAC